MNGKTVWILAGCCLLLSMNAGAEEDVEPDYGMLCGEAFPEEGEEIVLPEFGGWWSWLDMSHVYLSQSVENMATGIDRFFAGEKTAVYSTRSYVRVQNDTYWEERQDAVTKIRVKAKLDLPLTKRKLKLLVESDPTELQTPQEKVLEANPPPATSDNNLFVSVEKEKEVHKGWQLRPSIGLKLHSPVELFARLRLSNRYFPGKWEVRPQQTFYWFDKRGYGSDTVLELDRPLTDRLLFRSSSLLRWTEETDYFTASEVFSLFHTLSPKRKVSYQLGVYGNEVPSWHATQYLFSISYRQRIHSSWLFMEVRPQISYDKARGWDSTHSLLFRIEAVYGRTYMRK